MATPAIAIVALLTPEMEAALWTQATLLAVMAIVLGFLGGLLAGYAEAHGLKSQPPKP